VSALKRLGLLAAVTTGLAGLAPAAAADTLRAGVGRADITPPTGYYMMGWVRSDGLVRGQHTRLYARAIVLEKDGRKVALVAEDLNGIPGGVLKAAADRDKAYGFSEQNVLDSASHTHAGPSQFYNFGSYDTVFMTLGTPSQQNVSGALDPQLYAFEVNQLATAIRRADQDLGPARAGWGSTQLTDVTQNRSLEAHLANYGILEPYGAGSPSQDPRGPVHTIDPNVDVLRVDKRISSRRSVLAPRCRRRPSRGPRRKRRCHNKRGAHRFDRQNRRRRRAQTATPARTARRLTSSRRHTSSRPHTSSPRLTSSRPHTSSRRPAHRRRARARQPRHPATRTTYRYAPVAMWSEFADHGTVNKVTFTYYNADHHGAAIRLTEEAMRRQGQVPAGQDVVNAYGNSDEGDMSAGLVRSGPADAEWVGRREADAFMTAWTEAGRHLSDRLSVDRRWTRLCFCGQPTAGGMVDSKAIFGLPQLTGSEEGRGPLYDVTHVNFEDRRSATDDPVQGNKIQEAQPPALNVPTAVPVMTLRIGDRLIVSVPGEMTVGMGERVRDAVVKATAPQGITRAVIAGLANEYLSYFTTPEEYQRQHYEGGSTLYGRYSSNLLQATSTELARRLVAGQSAPTPAPFDPTNGVAADAEPFSEGASTATILSTPSDTPRLGHAVMKWTGGPRGFDRQVERAFVTIRRRVGASWQPVADDLGLQILWSVDDQGAYQATWEVPRDAPAGAYQLVVSANHYRLESPAFQVSPAANLTVRTTAATVDGATLTLDYPPAVLEQDFTYRPTSAPTGQMTVQVGGHPVTVTGRGGTFHVSAPPGTTISVAPGAARDGAGNTNANSVSLTT
jgi:neutral ceramidase